MRQAAQGPLETMTPSSSIDPKRWPKRWNFGGVARVIGVGLVVALTVACNNGSKSESPASADPSAAVPQAEKAAPVASASAAPSDGALHLGAPIEASAQNVSLADVAKAPQTFVGKTFATTGTVTAVCQHMGCWMEIKDDASEAHIKMAGHSFFVPKTASGRKARVLATLVKGASNGACEDGPEGMAATGGGTAKSGCRAEAEAQLGRPLAKLELVAQGVELL